MKKKIGIFGGSFDPPTQAHLQVGEELLDKGVVNEVWYMPALHTSHGKVLSSFDARVDMLMRMISSSTFHFGELHMTRWEAHIDDNNGRTLDTMTKFLKEYNKTHPDCEFYFIVGMDNALNIHKFYKWHDLINLMPFIILDRTNNRGDKINHYNPNGLWFNKEPHIYVDDIEIMEASSTQVRNELSLMNEWGLSATFFEMCNRDVFKYIIEKGLYEN